MSDSSWPAKRRNHALLGFSDHCDSVIQKQDTPGSDADALKQLGMALMCIGMMVALTLEAGW